VCEQFHTLLSIGKSEDTVEYRRNGRFPSTGLTSTPTYAATNPQIPRSGNQASIVATVARCSNVNHSSSGRATPRPQASPLLPINNPPSRERFIAIHANPPSFFSFNPQSVRGTRTMEKTSKMSGGTSGEGKLSGEKDA
jgi:hypothetical protein